MIKWRTKIMYDLPNCPKCNSEYTYKDGNLFVCPECAHEWSVEATAEGGEEKKVVRDVNGNILNDGDSVTVIKDLKVKGSTSTLKMGTKVKSIRLVEDADGGHDIDCKIPGFGGMYLKSQYVKKL
jgi:protein PhnA